MSRMLIVDDDPAWRNLYRMAFERQFELFEAMDGYQALSVLDAVRPDVIILDLRMPKMDGMDFLARLDRQGRRPQIVMCSGTFTHADRPVIPGVHLAAKTPDLKELWAALRSAVPEVAEVVPAGRQSLRVVEDESVWRD